MYALLLSLALLASPDAFADGAAGALARFEAGCRREGGRLWGVSLCGPMVIVEPGSRRAVANAADAGGALRRTGPVFVGELPADQGLANTAFDWGGERWSMVLWPLPEEPPARLALLLHEAWHRIQPGLGFPADMVANAHLAEESGRLWLRLESRALRRALQSSGAERRAAAADALGFRARRYALHPEARSEETALELNEGLAQYTGYSAGHGDGATAAALAALERADTRVDVARAFAYFTGPAWGLLLDDLRPAWREALTGTSNFGEIAAAALDADWPPAGTAAAIERRAEAYGYAEVAAQERERALERQREVERLLGAYVDSPALVLPLAEMQMSFDPNGVVPLPPHGSVYRRITIQDRWGEVEATGGALLAADFTSLALAGPLRREGPQISGEGWTLELAEGWRLEPEPDGRFRLLPPARP